MIRKNRLVRFIYTLFYFVGWGIFWGTLLGAVAGTLIFPMWGTLLSAGWGLGLGAGLGMIAALLAAFLYPMPPVPEQATFYRRRLGLVVGIVTAVSTPFLILLTSYDFIWRSLIGNYIGFAYSLLAPSLFAAGIFGGLAAASTASRFADKSEGKLDILDGFGNVVSSSRYFATKAANKWVWLFSAAFLLNDFREHYSYAARYPDRYLGAGLVGPAIIIGLLSLMIGALMGFLNRVYFTEYAAHWTLERYRITVMGITGISTLGLAAFWLIESVAAHEWLLFTGIMVIAGYATYLAGGYAEHYYAMPDKPKRKGKPKNSVGVQVLSVE